MKPALDGVILEANQTGNRVSIRFALFPEELRGGIDIYHEGLYIKSSAFPALEPDELWCPGRDRSRDSQITSCYFPNEHVAISAFEKITVAVEVLGGIVWPLLEEPACR